MSMMGPLIATVTDGVGAVLSAIATSYNGFKKFWMWTLAASVAAFESLTHTAVRLANGVLSVFTDLTNWGSQIHDKMNATQSYSKVQQVVDIINTFIPFNEAIGFLCFTFNILLAFLIARLLQFIIRWVLDVIPGT